MIKYNWNGGALWNVPLWFHPFDWIQIWINVLCSEVVLPNFVVYNEAMTLTDFVLNYK